MTAVFSNCRKLQSLNFDTIFEFFGNFYICNATFNWKSFDEVTYVLCWFKFRISIVKFIF